MDGLVEDICGFLIKSLRALIGTLSLCIFTRNIKIRKENDYSLHLHDSPTVKFRNHIILISCVVNLLKFLSFTFMLQFNVPFLPLLTLAFSIFSSLLCSIFVYSK